jgi:hypothetical protein
MPSVPEVNLTWEQVERYRDRTFHRRRSLRVRGAKSAMAFIREVGFCTAFSAREHLPCLWVAVCGRRRPRMPHHTHSDYAIGLTWELKDRLPDERRVFYGRLLGGKLSLISLEYLPYFYRIFGPEDSGEALGAPGLTEQGILDWLRTHPAQPTHALRQRADFRGGLSKTRFEKAIGRLQELFYVVKTQTVYEPKFTYYWGLFEKVFPEAVRRARRVSREAALERILRKYFETVLCARYRDLRSIFPALAPGLLEAALNELAGRGVVRRGAEISGAKGLWIVSDYGMMTPTRKVLVGRTQKRLTRSHQHGVLVG